MINIGIHKVVAIKWVAVLSSLMVTPFVVNALVTANDYQPAEVQPYSSVKVEAVQKEEAGVIHADATRPEYQEKRVYKYPDKFIDAEIASNNFTRNFTVVDPEESRFASPETTQAIPPVEVVPIDHFPATAGQYTFPEEAEDVVDGGVGGTGKHGAVFKIVYRQTPSTESNVNAPPVSQTGAPADTPTDTSTDTPTDTSVDVPTDTPESTPPDSPADTLADASTDTPTDTPTDAPPAGGGGGGTGDIAGSGTDGTGDMAGGGTGGTGDMAGGGTGGTGDMAGGGTGGTGDMAGGGTGGTGDMAEVYLGRITGFGSIYVNGNRFGVANAVIEANDEIVTDADLDVGMKVVVKANGTNALEVEYEAEIKGRVDLVDPVNSTLTVMGQTVIVDDTTVFGTATSLSELKKNDFVEVSGYMDAFGNIRAGFIENITNTVFEVQVKGFVWNHDPANMTFAINDLVIDYKKASEYPAIVDGSFVMVKGHLTGAALKADKVEHKEEVALGSLGESVEFEGLITAVHSQNEFEVNGRVVWTDGATVLRNGSASDLALNTEVVVNGVIDENGIIIADAVTLELWRAWLGAEAEMRGFVESVDVANSRLTLMGKTVYVDPSTSWKDVSALADLAPGDEANIIGIVGVGGSLTAIEVEFRNSDDQDIRLSGPLDQYSEISLDSFSILGMRVDVSDPDVRFKDKEEDEVDAATFFSLIDDSMSPGVMIEVEAVYENGVIRAEKIILQGHLGGRSEMRGFVESVDVANSSLTLMGKTVYVDPSTSWKDVSALADLAPGDEVHIVGLVEGGGGLTATEVEFRNSDDQDVRLNGPLDQYSKISLDSFSILGMRVDVSGSDVDFEGEGDDEVDAATFFSLIDDSMSPGTMISVKGVYGNGVFKAEKAEIGNKI